MATVLSVWFGWLGSRRKCPKGTSVNKLLKLSPLLYNWIHLRVSNGLSCRFWTDNWSSFGSMRQYLQLGTTSLGIPEMATLARSESQVQVHAVLTTILLNEEEDYYEWEIDGRTTQRYSTGEVYAHLRSQGPSVPWYHIIWNKKGIPRHSFLAWLFVLDRCPTRDRIIRWGLQSSPMCLLCNSTSESRDHLYFDCPFSWGIWSVLASRCDLNPERDWSRVMNQLLGLNHGSPKGHLTILCWQACLYWVWSERNARLHRDVFRSSDALICKIDRQIRDKILSFRKTNPTVSSVMMQQWLP
uniref:Reverse transcriptase zinc-binding domain-containing protein n=2 Tax=Brassica oleracea var. oleracea TaxID=109376 RepID=A0A0D3BXL7_BRAOL